ncbi:related to two-component system sensor histidine kinase (Ntr family) [Desulfotalea psychrophila LSv54]|uniref:histidine kinase n=2 Tax=Desulfotalea psychrophila TaxID=84980 RepID=Q6ARC0_DESPS|nr:related to two-component system sensor histidine kinase (Ntr family) [Desulfotalea psychrophila LSv54]
MKEARIMKKKNKFKHKIPQSPSSFQLSTGPFLFLFSIVIIFILFAISTRDNIHRAQNFMKSSLLNQGGIIISSIEAMNADALDRPEYFNNFISEISQNDEILFIAMEPKGLIIDKGRGLYNKFRVHLTKEKIESMRGTGLTSHKKEQGLFVISKLIQQGSSGAEQIISVGISTGTFDQAQEEDRHHAFIMTAILFLLALSGMYFLFLYQKMRSFSATIADMKLYTDSILKSVPVSIVTIDNQNRLISYNQCTTDILGLKSENLEGIEIDKIIPAYSSHLNSTNQLTNEIEAGDGGKEKRSLRISCSPLISQGQVNMGKVLVIENISKFKNMEAQLELSRRMAALGKMASGIAHEIRNPLGTLRGFAYFFGKSNNASEETKEYSQLMVAEIDRLNRIVSGLLQFSRPREPQLQTTCLSELLKKIKLLLEMDFSTAKIKVSWPMDQGIIINADPDLILQVLMNILRNSIIATATGGTIDIECSEDNDSVIISIADTGCGMSEKEREQMFDPFFTTSKTGTGLGLAVSHQIIAQHRGFFEVSTAQNRGTNIRIILPKKPNNEGAAQ